MRVCDRRLLDRVRWCEAIILSWMDLDNCHIWICDRRLSLLLLQNKEHVYALIIQHRKKKMSISIRLSLLACYFHARHAFRSLLILIYYVCGWRQWIDHRINSNSIKTGKTKTESRKKKPRRKTQRSRSDAVICFIVVAYILHRYIHQKLNKIL